MEWLPVAPVADVGTTPTAVVADGVPLVVWRPSPTASPVVFADRCPHRLVPLSAATAEDGRLRCAYHGWEFNGTGTCVELPSQTGAAPPRASLPRGPRVRVTDGMITVAADDVRALGPDPDDDLLTNVDPALRHAWHPVALASEWPCSFTLLGIAHEAGALLDVNHEPGTMPDVNHEPGAMPDVDHDAGTLLGVDHESGTLPGVDHQAGALLGVDHRAGSEVWGVQERWGLIWVALEEPLTGLFSDADADDAAYVGAWLPPARTPAPAGAVADNFLDVAHFPFVHAGTFGAAEEKLVPPYDVTASEYGCRSVQEQWFDNPEDPGVAQGLRPVRQRRRATYVHHAPFQLLLRLEELDTGAVKTILFFAQPETLTSTRIYTKMLLHGIGGVASPTPDVVAKEVAFEEAVLAEDLALQRAMRLPGLPLRPRDELHVRADLLGVALRRALQRFLDGASSLANTSSPTSGHDSGHTSGHGSGHTSGHGSGLASRPGEAATPDPSEVREDAGGGPDVAAPPSARA